MKRILLVLVIVLAALSVYWFMLRKKSSGSRPPKQAAMQLKKHSEKFNSSVDSLMGQYLGLKNAFVEGDSIEVKKRTASFISLLDSIPLIELKKDTASIFETAQASINDIRSNAASLMQQTDINEMRRDFAMVTAMMYPSFFKSINYEGPVLYLESCPMAFGEDQPGDWISKDREIVNPYLGKNHPAYKATMANCGEVKDSLLAK